MSILDKQYEALTDSTERMAFRTALLKLNSFERQALLKKQNQASLESLKGSVNRVCQQELPAADKQRFMSLLDEISLVVSNRQQDLPLYYDKMWPFLGGGESRFVQINAEQGEAYFTVMFPRVLNEAIREVLGKYEYSNNELMLQA
ncbi:MAG: hypothetical protein ACHP6H_04330, partial [Legionellales bacterium]